MGRETEKLVKEFRKFVEKNGGAQDNNELDELLDKFMAGYHPELAKEITEGTAKTADDFLELAESAETEKAALKYAKKALELEPDNIDAATMVIELSFVSFDKNIEKYKKLIDSAEKKLEADGYFGDDCVGEFWLISETRPYMRLLDRYAGNLINCGKMRLAIDVHEKMLKLCEGDNLGARYRLMSLYAFLEDDQSALGLFKKYPEEESVQFLLPLSILDYKLGNLRESEKYLKKMSEVNKDTRKFFQAANDGSVEKYFGDSDDADTYGYSPFTIEEYLEWVRNNFFLLVQSSAYFQWALPKIKTAKKK